MTSLVFDSGTRTGLPGRAFGGYTEKPLSLAGIRRRSGSRGKHLIEDSVRRVTRPGSPDRQFPVTPPRKPIMSEIIPARPIPLPWVSNVVEDRFGLSVVLRVGNAQQRFRWIAPGHFLMGAPADEAERGCSELPHEVTLSSGYWLADTACTQAFWLAVWPVNPSHFQDHPQNPAENVSWHDAQGFIAELNRRFPGLYARLPSEAEWEYACRAATTTPFSFGNQITVEQVNFHGNYPYIGGDKGLYRQRTVTVASLPANPWGLYEMHGNVWEWCADWYGEYPEEPQIDPRGPIIGKMRVLRGGTWSDPARYARSANRSRIEPAYRPLSSGFRIALGQIRDPVGMRKRIR